MPRSVRRGFTLLAAAGLVTGYAGCSSPTGPSSVSGPWNAGCQGASAGCTVLSLNESGSALSGSAETSATLYTVTGTYDRPRVSLVFVPANGAAGATIRYDGTASSVALVLHTEGSDPQALVFERGGVVFPDGGTDIAR
jgi:hypothetical protein